MYWFAEKQLPLASLDMAVVRYHARPIFNPGSEYPLDFLPDRQWSHPDTNQRELDGLMFWLNAKAIREIKKWIKDRDISTSSRECIFIQDYRYVLSASPSGSHGYCYIGAAVLPVEEAGTTQVGSQTEKVYVVNNRRFAFAHEKEIPLPGTKVNAKVNNLGKGVVVGYREASYGDPNTNLLLLHVKLDNKPKWLVEQNYQDAVDRAVKKIQDDNGGKHLKNYIDMRLRQQGLLPKRDGLKMIANEPNIIFPREWEAVQSVPYMGPDRALDGSSSLSTEDEKAARKAFKEGK